MNRLTFSKKRRIGFCCFVFVFFTGIFGILSAVYAADEVYSTPWDGSVAAVTPSGSTYTVTSAGQINELIQQLRQTFDNR